MDLFQAWLEKECSLEQAAPVLEQERNVVVTAGAGSGKTRTLVSRYLSLLLRFKDPRRVVAITFTEKAAEEMRSRARSGILSLIDQALDPDEIAELRALYSKLDAARISTIHGLCMEILLNDPAKASIDPASTVLEEVEAGMLKLGIIQETLEEIADDPRFDQVLLNINSMKLNKIFRFMLQNRLKIQDVLPKVQPFSKLSLEFFTRLFADPMLVSGFEELRAYSDEELDEAKKRFEAKEALICWDEAQQAAAEGDFSSATRLLHVMRYTHLKLTSSKKPAMQTLRELQHAFDDPYAAELGISSDDDFDPLPAAEYELVREGLLIIFEILVEKYNNELRQRQAIDFDAMEDYAVRLLRDPDIRASWQAKIDALMVDEFQDTNERQRSIVLALTENQPGKLFVVGDARQSIYRFRQADVSVFRRMLKDTENATGTVMELSTSYRTHEKLLTAVGDVLAPIMGTEPDPVKDYHIHFTPLRAHRLWPSSYTCGPFVEINVIDNRVAISSQQSMAYALAERLIQARKEEEIRSWGDVAILCRTTNSFSYYEDAFDEAGIAYATSSGKGFLTRPEVRDLINVLRGLSDPSDDLVMAGLLRSPMFGLSDAALYHLRPVEGAGFMAQLSTDLSALSAVDAEQARLASANLRLLLDSVDRLPVADLIKKVVDVTHYTAILAAADIASGSQRKWRNIEKLIEHARQTGVILLREYLELIDDYEDVGVDLGEAPAEAADAVKLMTIHASKGLEFPWVVLGDAGRKKIPEIKVPVIFDPQTGLAFQTDRYSLHFELSLKQEKEEARAEVDRLLYVALTRAQNKVIVNGVRMVRKDGTLTTGTWLEDISDALGDTFGGETNPIIFGSSEFTVKFSAPTEAPRWHGGSAEDQPVELGMDAMLLQNFIEDKSTVQEDDKSTAWAGSAMRATREEIGKVEGSLAHKAIELDLKPDENGFLAFARSFIYSAGLSDKTVVWDMSDRVSKLLRRYYDHPISEAVRAANEVYHELRYTLPAPGFAQTGIIDLLVKLPEGWVILDFKTDMIITEEEYNAALDRYRHQLHRYKAALYNIQKISATPKICFLDDRGEVSVQVV